MISLVTAALTVYDKIAAKTVRGSRRRIRENTLLLFGVFGGSAAELAVMLLIRHKTRHKKFMLGLPVILAIQLLAGALL